jgi:hypothetical protein
LDGCDGQPAGGDAEKGTDAMRAHLSAAVNEPPHPTGNLIVGSRACHDCGYCLEGQPIVREEHYGMLIARCPECGTVAALQEYPSLSGWGRRLGALSAVGWAGTLLCTALMIVSIIEAQMHWDNSAMMEPLAARVEAEWAPIVDQVVEIRDGAEFDTDTLLGRVAQAQVVNYGAGLTEEVSRAYLSPLVDSAWLSDQDVARWRRESTSIVQFLRSRPLIQWVNIVLGYFAIGAIAAGALYHLRGRGKLVVLGLLTAMTALFATSTYAQFETKSFMTGWDAEFSSAVARRECWPITCLLTMTVSLGAIGAGLWLGRPIARELLCLLLPPRACSSLAGLWHVDGLEPPPTLTDRKWRMRPSAPARSRKPLPATGSGAAEVE